MIFAKLKYEIDPVIKVLVFFTSYQQSYLTLSILIICNIFQVQIGSMIFIQGNVAP